MADVIVACSLLTFTLPLIVFIAVAIKCESPGRVLSRQERLRAGRRHQVLLKFRTTVNQGERDWRRGWRLTRMGQLLRYTRMDELPQLFDVLRGEVSLAELFNR
ncbi:MAG: sugar transferase [Acidobacteria bacterium]|nr:sugar transferase [Acidobacteriota bacterium]